MDDEKLTVDGWCETYLVPVIGVLEGVSEPTQDMVDGFAGFILDGILSVRDIDGEDANDWECVELVETLISFAKQIDL